MTGSQHARPLSEAAEDCLKALWTFESEDRPATTTALARALELTPGTVTTMLKRLASLELVNHRPYQGVSLTPQGRRVALEVVRHHRLLEMYLFEKLGYTWDEVHDEAEALEHSISEDFEDRVAEMLGHPTHDPHGDPIPPKDGQPAAADLIPLTDLATGERAVIARVRDTDPELLRSMAAKGLVLAVEVEALGRKDDERLRLSVDGHEIEVTPEQASQVFVRRPG